MKRLWRMTRAERGWTRVVFETLYPGRVPPTLDGFLDDLLDALPRAAGLGLRGAVAAVTLASNAPGDAVERFARSEVYLLRSAFTLLKATGAMACAPTSGFSS